MVRKLIVVLSDSSVGGLNVISFEGRLSDNEGVDDDSERPDVDFVRVTLLSFQYFRSDIVRGTTDSSLPLTIKFKFGSKTKISEFDLHLVIKEQVSEFEISMDDPVGVEILHGITNLYNVALDFEFGESLSSSKEFVKSLTLAKF